MIRALQRYRDFADPRSGSIMYLGPTTSGAHRDAFHPGLIAGLEERGQLVAALRRIGPRERLLLYLWYAEGQPVSVIAKRLGISRMHCYRLRDRALAAMTQEESPASLVDDRRDVLDPVTPA